MTHVVCDNDCASLCNYKEECGVINHKDLFGHHSGPGSGSVSNGKRLLRCHFEQSIKSN